MDLTVNQEVEEQTYSFKTAGTYVEDDINLTVAMANAGSGGSTVSEVREGIYTGTDTATSLTAGTATSVAYVDLSEGLWFVTGNLRFASNSNVAYRILGLNDSKTFSYESLVELPASSSVPTVEHVSKIFKVEKGTTKRAYLMAQSSVALNVDQPRLVAGKIATSGGGDNSVDVPVGTVITLGSECYSQGRGTSTTASTGSSYGTLKNPNAFGYPGTWQLVFKTMTPKVLSSGFMSIRNTTNVTSIGTQHCYISGTAITIHGSFVNKNAHSDTARELITISPSALGLTTIGGSTFVIDGVDDGLNGIPILTLTNAGVLSEIDFIPRATSIPTGTGGTTSFTFTLAVTSNYICDSACNQFHWKRTA